ncbi:neprilysin-1-like [Ixodes scapularis]
MFQWVDEYSREDFTTVEESNVMSTEAAVCLAVSFAVMVILVFSLVQFLFPAYDRGLAGDKAGGATTNSDRTSLESCKDKACFDTVRIIRRSINANVNPCHDFYRFACGSFSDPSEQILNQMTEEMYSHVQKVLADLSVPKHSQKPSEKAAGLYQACRSVREHRVDESESLRRFMDGAGLFLTNTAEGDALDTIARLAFVYNINAVLKMSAEDYASKANGIQLKVGIHTNHVDWITRRVNLGCDHSVEFYKRHIMAYGLREDSQVTTELIKQIINLEDKAVGWLPDEKLSCLQTFISVERRVLPTYTSNIHSHKWTALLTNQSNVTWKTNQQVIVSPCALEYFNNLYGGVQATGVNLLVTWDVLRLLAPLTYPAAASLYGEPSAKRLCLAAVVRVMEVAALSTYLFKAVPREAMGATETLLKNIRETALIKIDSANWIEGHSRSGASQKLSSMQPQISYSSLLLSEEALNQRYNIYPTTGCSFLNIWVKASRLTAKALLEEQPRYGFHVDTPLVTFVPVLNKIQIPAFLLRPPLFELGGLSSFNYGGLGHMVAHEMMHAFNLTGSQKDSSVNGRYWWTPLTGRNYTEKVRCFREEYDQLVQGRGGQTRELTDSEIMGDFIGLWLAFQTFRDLGDKKRFADLPYNSRQLFFIASCVKLCVKRAAPTSRMLSSMRARCNVPLMNFPEFSEAFNCSRGTIMNPSRRCQLWKHSFCFRR